MPSPTSPAPARRRARALPAASVLALLSAQACAEAPLPWPQEAHQALALEKGAAAADQLSGTLIRHLTAALDSAGPVGAIDFCSTEAPILTAGAVAGMEGLDIKRTSTRVRNPANAPDSLEAAALAYFEAQMASTGALPQAWVQAEGEGALRYYRPLVVNELCVQCHGPLTALASDVVAKLGERYPTDQATGYLPGDFRGLIRVRVPRAALEAAPGA